MERKPRRDRDREKEFETRVVNDQPCNQGSQGWTPFPLRCSGRHRR